eukprot:CAMPEP_0201724076 /NCGR_PEP_ID=MMETSP0593-20130828/7918_1 /ASSEMBLY_ACC=CAM_ASM_000672 /TAXON_ID=267983 /ORGANISM="Skeletonema japonicum, Strain CCMP2506" /LENGTH=546 /DNA_ID=CAMNT_0048215269 /DNA_START=82 /DNA_END=1722 /DNA_ORIENTATION=+
MDITIPPHNLKRFTAAITCLGKIGKDLYLSFDPLDGLILSSLNEAKSAFGKFQFDPTFFDRCSAPAVVVDASSAVRHRSSASSLFVGRGRNTTSGRNYNNNSNSDQEEEEDDNDDEFYDSSSRYVCRVPVRSVHSILRPRKGVCSLRIRSEGTDDSGNHFGLKNSTTTNKRRKRRRNINNREEGVGHDEEGGDDDDIGREGVEEEERRPYSSSARRRRKRRSQKRNNNSENSNGNGNNNDLSAEKGNDKMMLSFEFFIERTAPNQNRNATEGGSTTTTTGTGGGGTGTGGGTFRVLHKVGVTDANGITLSATRHRRDRSEIVSPPKLWLRLLDPLRRTAEVALTVDDELKVVTATSFHPGEMHGHGGVGGIGGSGNHNGGTEENAVLQAAAAKEAVLKTETSTGTEEFDEYDFRNNRGRKKKRRRRRRADDDDNDDEEDSDTDDSNNEDDEERESDKPPPDANQKVILVFSIKEAKAMLQFCAQTNSSFHDDGDALSILSFHWGGKPVVIETDGDSFSGELVLATLHHGMIASNITVGGNRRESSG